MVFLSPRNATDEIDTPHDSAPSRVATPLIIGYNGHMENTKTIVSTQIPVDIAKALRQHAEERNTSLSAVLSKIIYNHYMDEYAEGIDLALGTAKVQSHGAGGRIQLPLQVAERVCSHAGQLCAFYPILGRPHSVELRPI